MKKLYYTITEVSNLLELKPYVIRYWETEFPQLKMSRKTGRNRRYSPKEVETIKRIKTLLYDKKYTIKGAKAHLKDGPKKQPEVVKVTKGNEAIKEIIDKVNSIRTIVRETLDKI